MNAGKAIGYYQTMRCITGAELSRRMGIKPQQLSRWRQTEDMKLSAMIRVASALEVPVSDFVQRAAEL